MFTHSQVSEKQFIRCSGTKEVLDLQLAPLIKNPTIKNNLQSSSLCSYIFSLLQQTNSRTCYKELATAASDFQLRFEVDIVFLKTWNCTG